MPRLQGLSAFDQRRLRSGRPCLDFTHTGAGPLAAYELVHDADDAARWLGVVLDVHDVRSEPRRLADVFALRDSIWTAALRVIAGRPPTLAARRTINDAAAKAPWVPALATDGSSAITEPVTVNQALSTLARDAIDLLGGPTVARLRQCAAPYCPLLFVDLSRPGSRRWCSMELCGNVAKVRRHRAR